MPHLIIDYSANLDDALDMAAFCNAVRVAAIETGVFPTAGIRVRATRCEAYSIADGDPKHAYLDISVRLREGRDLDTRKRATDHIFTAAKSYLEPVMADRPIALSLEMRNIDAELAPKHSTIRDHLKESA